VNDFHHAHDAYLNIVVGNVYYVKFTKNPINFIRNEYARDAKTFNYNLSKMFDWDVARGEEIAWKAQTEEGAGTIVTVKKMLAKNTPLLTRFSFEGHGAIANATLYGASKAKKDGYIPLKSSDERMLDVTKYGGFTSTSAAYFFLVEHEVKGKKVRTLETVSVYEKDKIAQEPEALQRYCEQTLGLIHPSVRISRIKIQSLIKINGYEVHISKKSGKQIGVRNAVSMCLRQNWMDYIHLLEKYREKQDLDEKITATENIRLYDILTEKHTKAIYQKRLNPIGKKLIDAREKFEQLTVEKQSLVLLQILQATQIGIAAADLTLIGGTANSGVMLFGKNITALSECKLINQSVTGLFESSVDLLTV
jgi:CRISPR-associated endonuclease Csn1